MSHTKCSHCGLVNWSSDEVCERCAAPLAANDATVSAPEPARPDLPNLTFGQDVSSGSKAVKLVVVVMIALVILGGAWVIYKRYADSRRANRTQAARRNLAPPTVEERTRDTMLAYLTQPGFAGTKVVEQVLGPVRLEMLYVPDREVYFSAPEHPGQTFETLVASFVIDPKRIVMAVDDGAGRLRIGEFSLVKTADKHVFFKTPVDNLKFDSTTVLKFPFKLATYTLNMSELGDFLQNKSIFGGRMHARMEKSRGGQPLIFANHGALVARPEETSLRRFVSELTRDIPADGEGAREARVQRVLDFVSREITYDLRATTYNFELLKRPNEVLMSGESDCSNKAILFGSLLEQIGEDYIFIYTPDHITVAVRQGGFPARNGLSLEWEGQTWLIAEGTAPGFRIGIDRVRDEARLKQFQHVQRPRDRDLIFDLATGRQLSFQ